MVKAHEKCQGGRWLDGKVSCYLLLELLNVQGYKLRQGKEPSRMEF